MKALLEAADEIERLRAEIERLRAVNKSLIDETHAAMDVIDDLSRRLRRVSKNCSVLPT